MIQILNYQEFSDGIENANPDGYNVVHCNNQSISYDFIFQNTLKLS